MATRRISDAFAEWEVDEAERLEENRRELERFTREIDETLGALQMSPPRALIAAPVMPN